MIVKGMAISVAKNYWPQGFNERSCGFMIPENWARPVQIGLRNRETFATSFVALDKPLHLNLIKRMQRACCLRYAVQSMHFPVVLHKNGPHKQYPPIF